MPEAFTDKRILIVDDKPEFIETTGLLLKEAGYNLDKIKGTGNSEGVRAHFSARNGGIPDLVLLDVKLGEENGLDILSDLTSTNPHLPVIIISGYLTQPVISEAKKRGAYAVVTKDDRMIAELPDLFSQALKPQIPSETIRKWKTKLKEEGTGALVGMSPPMMRVYDDMGTLAPHDYPITVYGPTGSGKGLVGKEIHGLSEREGKCIVVDSGRYRANPQLQQAHLFGAKKGAWTGLMQDMEGAFQQAKDGTVIVDEGNKLTLENQALFLGVLDDHKFDRVGEAGKKQTTNARVIFLTNETLEELLASGRLIEDLYRRISVPIIPLPSLDERGEEDKNRLIAHFIEKYAFPASPDISEEAYQFLIQRRYPQNVGELENLMRTAIAYSGGRGRMIRREHFRNLPQSQPENRFLSPQQAVETEMPLEEYLSYTERGYLEALGERTNFILRNMPAIAGEQRRQLMARFKRLKIDFRGHR